MKTIRQNAGKPMRSIRWWYKEDQDWGVHDSLSSTSIGKNVFIILPPPTASAMEELGTESHDKRMFPKWSIPSTIFIAKEVTNRKRDVQKYHVGRLWYAGFIFDEWTNPKHRAKQTCRRKVGQPLCREEAPYSRNNSNTSQEYGVGCPGKKDGRCSELNTTKPGPPSQPLITRPSYPSSYTPRSLYVINNWCTRMTHWDSDTKRTHQPEEVVKIPACTTLNANTVVWANKFQR